jgi:hypothetical protein
MSVGAAAGVQGTLQIQMMKAAQQQQMVAAQAVADALQNSRAIQAEAARAAPPPGQGQVVDVRV